MAVDFTSLPILDLQEAHSPDTKPSFLLALRDALVNVGFLYLKNPPIPDGLQDKLVEKAGAFFGLPTDVKENVQMVNSKYIRGWTALGVERTATTVDRRETFIVLFPSPKSGGDSTLKQVPDMQPVFEAYIASMQGLADEFTSLVAEALDLSPKVLSRLFNDPPLGLLKSAAYPNPGSSSSASEDTNFQGVGPHKDASFLTYLLQGTGHLSSLEVQNKSGAWISAPPIPNTLVINIGRGLEALTEGVCVATTHRVNLSPSQYIAPDGSPLGTRLSFPFFQTLHLDLRREDMSLDMPAHILSLRQRDVKSDAETFLDEIFKGPYGVSAFTSTLTSHPEVGRRWYPEILAEALEQQEKGKRMDDLRKETGANKEIRVDAN
ncbi:hypothetical protein VI817_003415 [Penicillium citrinum]|nr:hypothetical protein VI817_003415 [Penicillium citrinum]